MPKKRIKKKVVEEPVTETSEEAPEVVSLVATTEQTTEEEAQEKEEKKPRKKKSDTVQVKVIIGTLEFEDGVFEKDSVFETTRERAEKFEKTSVQILD